MSLTSYQTAPPCNLWEGEKLPGMRFLSRFDLDYFGEICGLQPGISAFGLAFSLSGPTSYPFSLDAGGFLKPNN